MEPVPLSENAQFDAPGRFAVPMAVTATEVPFSAPDAFPDSVMLPVHTALNVPRMVVVVCVAIWNWKLPHVVALDTVGAAVVDANVPTSEGVVPLLVLVVPAVVLGAAVDVVGAVTLVEC